MSPCILAAIKVQALTENFLFFLLACFVVALVTSAIRLRDPGKLAAETFRFFLTVAGCILLFAGLVAVVEWIFIRPLI